MGREPAGARRQRPRFATPGAALALGVFIVVMLVSAAVIGSVTHQLRLSGVGQVGLILSFAVVGVIVAWHQPRNPMGWVLLAVTFFFLLDDLASSYAYLDYRLHGGRLPLGWLAVLLAPSWAPAIVLAGLSLLLFPDGRLPPPSSVITSASTQAAGSRAWTSPADPPPGGVGCRRSSSPRSPCAGWPGWPGRCSASGARPVSAACS